MDRGIVLGVPPLEEINTGMSTLIIKEKTANTAHNKNGEEKAPSAQNQKNDEDKATPLIYQFSALSAATAIPVVVVTATGNKANAVTIDAPEVDAPAPTNPANSIT